MDETSAITAPDGTEEEHRDGVAYARLAFWRFRRQRKIPIEYIAK